MTTPIAFHSHGPSRIVLGALFCAMLPAFIGGCDSNDHPATPTGPPVRTTPVENPDATYPPALRIGPGNLDAIVASANATRQVAQRGFECGWFVGWQKHVLLARRDDAPAFRARTLAGATGLGVFAVLFGLVGIVIAATVYPRMRRAAQLGDHARPPATARQVPARPWLEMARQLARSGLKRVGKWLHLEHFDPMRADRWGEALAAAFEAERQLRCAIVSARGLVGNDLDAGREVVKGLDAWRSELKRWRLAWEEEPLPPGSIQPENVVPTLTLALRAARDLRIAMTRAQTRGDAPDWRGWLSDLASRPHTPDAQAPGGAPPSPTTLRIGWLGLGCVALGIFFTAGWFAAGAMPLFFALTFSIGGLGTVTWARLQLRQAGGFRLLPGFADRAARWLVAISVVATGTMVVSSWMSGPSGLDLGDAPPIAMPDPAQMKPPDIHTRRADRSPNLFAP